MADQPAAWATLIPLDTCPTTRPSWPATEPVVLYCKTGVRSAGALALSANRSRGQAPRRGITAWAKTVDPEVPVLGGEFPGETPGLRVRGFSRCRAPNLGARESLPPNLVGEDVGGRLAARTLSDVIEATDAAGNTRRSVTGSGSCSGGDVPRPAEVLSDNRFDRPSPTWQGGRAPGGSPRVLAGSPGTGAGRGGVP